MKQRCLIIAEAGVNHNGKLNNARELVNIAVAANADFIKFQIFNTEELVKIDAPRAKYQIINSKKNESHYEMLKKLELDEHEFRKIINYCKQKKIKFLASIFSINLLLLVKKFQLKYIKIPSGEITNAPLLEEIGKLKKTIFLSTGMSNIKEIREAVNILIKSGTKKNKIYVLQCNTEYPTPKKDINLNAMNTIKKNLRIKVGFSDHSTGKIAGIAAAVMGAEIIEKHITIDKKMKGPDHKASMNKREFVDYVNSIRDVDLILGKKNKTTTSSERKNLKIARRSIYAKRDITVGQTIMQDDLIMLRPNIGVSPMKYKKVVGKKAKKNYKKHDLISF
jgi:N,N'-diacetyllegionaminate synthase